MIATKVLPQPSKPVFIKKITAYDRTWSTVFRSAVSKGAAAGLDKNVKYFTKPTKTVAPFKMSKRVNFADKLISSVATPMHAADDVANTTWYDDSAYQYFLAESRNAVKIAQQALLDTGSLNRLDPSEHTVSGLEQFLSPTIEMRRAQRCRQHIQAVLRAQDIQKDLDRAISLRNCFIPPQGNTSPSVTNQSNSSERSCSA